VIRSIAAVLAGYVAMFAGVTLATILAAWIMLGGFEPVLPTPAYLAVNLAYSLFFAALGGYVTARIASISPMGHVWVLTAIVAVLAVLVLLVSSGPGQDRQPAWYPYAILVVGIVGIPLGGKLRAARELSKR
jgi:hypothetical protein